MLRKEIFVAGNARGFLLNAPLCCIFVVCFSFILPSFSGAGEEIGNAGSVVTPRDVLSLIVSGEDSRHLTDCLQHLVWLRKNRGVKVGNVFIVDLKLSRDSGSTNTADSDSVRDAIDSLEPEVRDRLKAMLGQGRKINRRRQGFNRHSRSRGRDGVSEATLTQFSLDAGVPEQEVLPSERVFSRYDVENSPTWVVRHRGQDYVLEGFTDLTRFFTSEGEFSRESW